jgi:AbrB family looped-hinge helix DNA binding protein
MTISSSILSSKSQITVPKSVRLQLKVKPGERMVYRKQGNRIYLERDQTALEYLDSSPLKGMYAAAGVDDIVGFVREGRIDEL